MKHGVVKQFLHHTLDDQNIWMSQYQLRLRHCGLFMAEEVDFLGRLLQVVSQRSSFICDLAIVCLHVQKKKKWGEFYKSGIGQDSYKAN